MRPIPLRLTSSSWGATKRKGAHTAASPRISGRVLSGGAPALCSYRYTEFKFPYLTVKSAYIPFE
jgi:hypothetical protein